MAKKVVAVVKLHIPAGKASPAPPVGTALGQHGINIMTFCKEFNSRTASQAGQIVPVEITIYADCSFTFVTKTPPASDLLNITNTERIKEKRVTTMMGRLIESYLLRGEPDYQIDVSRWNSGIYLIIFIDSAERPYKQKLVIQ